MKRFYLLFVLIFPIVVFAQQSVVAPVSALQEPSSSSLDLLKNANKNKSISIGKKAPVPTPEKESTKKTPSVETTSSTAAPVSVPDRPIVATPAPAAAATSVSTRVKNASAASGNTLDIPMAVGNVGNVQATVQPVVSKKTTSQSAKKTSSQATDKQKELAPAENPTPQDAQPSPEQEALLAETEEAAADAELEYAVRLLEQSKKEATQGRAIPPSAAKNKTATVPSKNKKFNPNAFRPNVEWNFSKSNHFDIYTQKSTNGKIGSANLAMAFEESYQTLRRFIPWMMSGRVRVFVYQDHNSYLKYEPNAKAWTRALAYPTRGEIVVYDEPGKSQELKEVFSHELTHIFTQQFFDKHQTGRIMTPTWLDEGLAVFVEDQAYSGGKGGPWTQDYKTLNIQRDPKELPADFSSSKMFSGSSRNNGVDPRNGFGKRGRPVRLENFEVFMEEGSLEMAEGQNKTQQWYLQAYLMVRFLLNPAGGTSPSNRMQFEQFTRLMAEGEPVRNPNTGFLMKDAKGKTVYKPYDTEKALNRAYHYSTIDQFEDQFWRWLRK